MINIDFERMQRIVQNFKKKRVLVLGDLMLDRYIWGHVTRISPEAPVPVVEVKRDTYCLGGAGNVSFNLESLGAQTLPVGTIGNDLEGNWIKKKVVESQGIFTEKKIPTIIKTRIIAHHQQIVRVDQEKKGPLSSMMEENIFNFLQQEQYDGILISDYNKGVITKSLMEKVLPYAEKKQIPVFVDPKVKNFYLFSPVTLITPNHIEVERIVHTSCLTDSQICKAAQKILSKISTRYLIIKRGEQGMSVFEKGRGPLHIPAIAKEVYDVTGAGDTAIATATLALLSGASLQEAALLANTASGVVVGKIGTAAVSPKELLTAMASL
ncbi:D-glycero-beta-D-manno-heptose-7-phosphate kinase [Acidobacteriota bacterium]